MNYLLKVTKRKSTKFTINIKHILNQDNYKNNLNRKNKCQYKKKLRTNTIFKYYKSFGIMKEVDDDGTDVDTAAGQSTMMLLEDFADFLSSCT